ncbi:MAG TPA: hypothetical protein VJN21_14600 [Candidatus Acidoferrales bacterium]|nr:hypothetical protein [Candidatus Acidoferrales bacterium]
MIAALIFVVSFAVLLQFFVSYSRSIIAAYRKSELSEQVREVVGIEGQEVGSEDFGRLVQLVRLCPQRSDDQTDLKVVGLYYRMLGGLRALTKSLAPQIFKWAEQERMDCTYFVAVALDRRIAYSRDLLAQQMSQQ